MTSLVKYEAARLALAECKSFDEAKSWVDKAEAMRAYGRMAKDKTMEIDAAEIRLRAERRLGEMLLEQKETIGLNRGTAGAGRPSLGGSKSEPPKSSSIPTLAEAGIDKKLSMRAQQYASVPPEEFEAVVENWRDKVSADGVRVSLKIHDPAPSAAKPAKQAAAIDKPLPKKDKPVHAEKPASPPDQADDFGPTEEELRANELEEQANLELLNRLMAEDDKLAAAIAECKRLNAELAAVKSARDGYMNKCAELTSLLRSANAKIDRLTKPRKG